MRLICLSAAVALLALNTTATSAQQITASVPSADQGSYDPQLTAKEAVLTNWKLAISGLRAGKFVSDNVVAAQGSPYAKVAQQAEFAAKTMLLRYASSYWLFAMDDTLAPIDGKIILAALEASKTRCGADCARAAEQLTRTFAAASAALESAALAAEASAAARADLSDTVALAELLSDMATYLASNAWYQDLTLTSAGQDGEEVSSRIIGTLAVWRNVEPFVGLRSPEIDASINAAINTLLRDVRRNTRGKALLPENSDEIETIRRSARIAAAEFKRAAQLFSEG